MHYLDKGNGGERNDLTAAQIAILVIEGVDIWAEDIVWRRVYKRIRQAGLVNHGLIDIDQMINIYMNHGIRSMLDGKFNGMAFRTCCEGIISKVTAQMEREGWVFVDDLFLDGWVFPQSTEMDDISYDPAVDQFLEEMMIMGFLPEEDDDDNDDDWYGGFDLDD